MGDFEERDCACAGCGVGGKVLARGPIVSTQPGWFVMSDGVQAVFLCSQECAETAVVPVPERPQPKPGQRLEQFEMERAAESLRPLIAAHIGAASPLLPEHQRGLVVLGAVLQESVRLAISIGMARPDFEKRVAWMADKGYVPAVVTPRILT